MTPQSVISATLSAIYSQRTGKEVKVVMTCSDCRYKNRCMERSRNVPCISFEERRKE